MKITPQSAYTVYQNSLTPPADQGSSPLFDVLDTVEISQEAQSFGGSEQHPDPPD